MIEFIITAAYVMAVCIFFVCICYLAVLVGLGIAIIVKQLKK